MATKKRRGFLDLLIRNPKEKNSDSSQTEEKEVNIKASSEKTDDFSMTKEEPLEKKEWLAEAADEGQLTLDVYQTDKNIIIKSTIAGVKPEDLDISFNNGMIAIKGERKEEEKVEKENYFYQELYWGSFSRSVILPTEVDMENIKAELKNGILEIELPKKESTKQKKIKVRAA